MGIMTRIADGLANLASGLGTSADRRTHSKYVFCPMTPQQVEATYRGSWLMRKIVDIPAKDMTREGRDWQAEAADITKLEAEEKRLQVWAKVRAAAILGRLGGGALILGLPGDTSQPVNWGAVSAKQLRYVHVISRHRLTLGQEITDPESEYYGWPEYFTMTETAGHQVTIDPSRVVPFRGLPVPELGTSSWEDRFWGDSVIQAIDEAVKNCDTAQGGFASLIDEAKVDTVSIPGLIDLVATTEGERALQRRVEVANIFKSIWNTRIIDGGNGEAGSGEEWETRQINWAGIPAIMDAFKSFVAGAADIPETRLFGRSAAGMNATGEGDLTNYYDALQGDQDAYLRPSLEHLDRALIPSAGVTASDIWFTFAPLSTPTEQEQATTFDKTMDAVTKAQNTGTIPDEALAKAVQNLIVERGWMPGLEGALAEIPETERFGLNPPTGDEDEDPSALAGTSPAGRSSPGPDEMPQ